MTYMDYTYLIYWLHRTEGLTGEQCNEFFLLGWGFEPR